MFNGCLYLIKKRLYFASNFFVQNKSNLNCEQSLIFLCKNTARETQGRERQSSLIVIITSWFAIVLDETRTRRILREKADCKQSTQI